VPTTREKILTEVTSFLAELDRGSKAAASTRVAAQAATAVIDLAITISALTLTHTEL
jgi:hypothetical protein